MDLSLIDVASCRHTESTNTWYVACLKDHKDKVYQEIHQAVQLFCSTHTDCTPPEIDPSIPGSGDSVSQATFHTANTKQTAAAITTVFDNYQPSTKANEEQSVAPNATKSVRSTRSRIPSAIVAMNSYAKVAAGQPKPNNNSTGNNAAPEGDAMSNASSHADSTIKSSREIELEETIEKMENEKAQLNQQVTDLQHALETQKTQFEEQLAEQKQQFQTLLDQQQQYQQEQDKRHEENSQQIREETDQKLQDLQNQMMQQLQHQMMQQLQELKQTQQAQAPHPSDSGQPHIMSTPSKPPPTKKQARFESPASKQLISQLDAAIQDNSLNAATAQSTGSSQE